MPFCVIRGYVLRENRTKSCERKKRGDLFRCLLLGLGPLSHEASGIQFFAGGKSLLHGRKVFANGSFREP